MVTLVRRLRCHLDDYQDRMRVFAERGVQVEGWLKGELLYFLSRLRDEGQILDFDQEVQVLQNGADRHEGRPKRVDLRVKLPGRVHYVELKHIASRNEVANQPGFFIPDRVKDDAAKLVGIKEDAARWLLLLLTGNPGDAAWAEAASGFETCCASSQLVPLTTPSDYPQSYFLGLV